MDVFQFRERLIGDYDAFTRSLPLLPPTHYTPADIYGDDYPSETFRVLKNNETRQFGEYRTWRLVLEAWDAQAGART